MPWDDFGSKKDPWGQRPQQLEEVITKLRETPEKLNEFLMDRVSCPHCSS